MQMRMIVLTIAMVTGTAAIGHAERTAKPATKAAAKQPAPKVKSPVASGVKAAKDHPNAKLRELTDAEDAALGPNPSTGVVTTVRAGSVAGTTAILGDDMLSDLVVAKQPDGSLKSTCGSRGKHRHPHPQQKPARAIAAPQALETK